MKPLWTACVGIALLIVPVTAHAGNVPEPAGYRMDNYRAAVPSSLQGASVISTDEAERLWERKEALFLDVMPRLPKPKDLPEGTIWRDKPRHNIPGSVWFANVGYGALTTEMETYFRGARAQNRRGLVAQDCVLLHDRLLDVVERRKARAFVGLRKCPVVSGRGRRMGSRRFAAGRSHAILRLGVEAVTANSRSSPSHRCGRSSQTCSGSTIVLVIASQATYSEIMVSNSARVLCSLASCSSTGIARSRAISRSSLGVRTIR